MSYYEGSNYQAKREDAGLPMFDPINLSKEDLIKTTQTAISSQKEHERNCQRLEKALSICHDLLRDIDIYADQPEQSGWSVRNCSKIASDGLSKLYREFPDFFLKGVNTEQKVKQ